MQLYFLFPVSGQTKPFMDIQRYFVDTTKRVLWISRNGYPDFGLILDVQKQVMKFGDP